MGEEDGIGGERVAEDLMLLPLNRPERRLSLAASCESDEPESIDMARRWEEVDSEETARGASEESIEGRRLPKLKKLPFLADGGGALLKLAGLGEVEDEGGMRDETDDAVDPDIVRERGRPPSESSMDVA